MFDKYSDEIKSLKGFEKEDILNETFRLFRNSNMEIYYAPHNEIENEKAKVFIVGITPGWTQTKIAYQTAYESLNRGLLDDEIKMQCKRNSRFAGSMRTNLIDMLDELSLNKYLKLDSCGELFAEADNLLHTTSIIPYPVFINKRNYTGSNPSILENSILTDYMKKYFYKEVSKLSNTLIIPLGKAVEEVLEKMIEENLIKKEHCLLGFPHPSGANGHRKKQFENNREKLRKIIKEYFNEEK